MRPRRTVGPGLTIDLALRLLALGAVLLVGRALGVGPLLLAATVFLYAWALRRPEPPQTTRNEAWGYASAMTYGLPSSPFPDLKAHQRAVRRVVALRDLGAQVVAIRTGYPRRFVDAVLSYLDDGGHEGGAGVGARRKPLGPGPLAAAE